MVVRTERDLKIQFVKMLFKFANPFQAALQVFPGNTNRALLVATQWPNDPEVIELKENMLEEDEDEGLGLLPNKTDAAKSIWEKAHSEFIEHDDFQKLMKLYCEVRGFIEKPQTNVQVNNSTVENKIMVIRDSGSDEEWEEKLKKQQESLVDEAE